jgi:hypothetical protein
MTDMDEVRFHAEFYRDAKRLHHVPYISRYGALEEELEMERFINEAASLCLNTYLRGIYYDSNASLCLIKTVNGLSPESDAAAQLTRAAHKHIAQFELLGVIGHGGSIK